MRKRWLRIGVLAAALFAINLAARLVGRLGYGDGTAEHLAALDRLAWAGWGAVVLTLAVTAGWWIRLRPQGEVGMELAGAIFAAALLSVVAGAYVSEPPRFPDGLGGVIIELSVYLLVGGLGALVGTLLLIAAGRDFKSQALRRYAESKRTRPGRAVRG
jgi:hypothetical protein